MPDRRPAQARVPHQVRTVTLQVEILDNGSFRLSTPAARGWAQVERSTDNIGRAVVNAFTEAQCAAYARWRGQRYDLDEMTEPVPGDPMAPPRRPLRPRTNRANVGFGRNQDRPDQHPIEDWERLADGRLRSPTGRVYRHDSVIAQRVVERARRAGLNL